MEFNVWVEVLDWGSTIACHKVGTIERPSRCFRPEELCLFLAVGERSATKPKRS
jgi:hypothetical protein